MLAINIGTVPIYYQLRLTYMEICIHPFIQNHKHTISTLIEIHFNIIYLLLDLRLTLVVKKLLVMGQGAHATFYTSLQFNCMCANEMKLKPKWVFFYFKHSKVIKEQILKVISCSRHILFILSHNPLYYTNLNAKFKCS